MSRRAWAYLLVVIAGGAALFLGSIPTIGNPPAELPLFVLLTGLATLAHLFEATGPTHESWNANLVFFFAGLLLLNPCLFALLIIIPHCVQLIDARLKESNQYRNWYIQPFNISTHLIAGFASRAFLASVSLSGIALDGLLVLAILAAVLIYVCVNHFLVAAILVLARGISWRESGILNAENLLTDAVLLCLGYVFAAMWGMSPWLLLPALCPLILVYRVLTIPQLRKDAQTDTKTGLFNAGYLAQALATEFGKAASGEQALSIIMADLDYLRNINNTYGHLAGDIVLIGVAKILRETVGARGIVGRFGGEEYAAVLPRTTESEAALLAETARSAIAEKVFQTETSNERLPATVSFGVAAYGSDMGAAKDLTHEADVAMYQAKLAGRNRVVCASEVPRSARLHESGPDARLEAPFPAAHTEPSKPGAPVPESSPAASSAAAGVEASHGPSSEPKPGHAAPSPVLWPLIGCVAFGAGIVTALGFHASQPLDLVFIILFSALAAIAELFQMDLYGDGSVSVSMAVLFATAVVAGIPGIVVASAGIALVGQYLRRPPFYRTIYNWATHVLAALGPVLLIHYGRVPLQHTFLPVLTLYIVVAAAAYFMIETGLIAAAISLFEKRSWITTWSAQYRWLLPHYLVMSLMGSFLAVAYQAMGLSGVLVFALPIIMMRYAQKQYVARTESSVQEMRRMNQQLTLANREIGNASRAMRQLNDELFLTLSKIIDARDPFVGGHAAKVAQYAVAVGQALGMTGEQLEHLRQAGLLHDIGKLGVPEWILGKPDKLSNDEYIRIKTHSALGAEFLETCHGLRNLAPMVRHHHEHWNGSGYPDHLRAEEISLEARILAVCDAVEAMASDRPYHKGMTPKQIVAELRRCAGSQFDPRVVDGFIEVIAKRGETFIVNSAREVTAQEMVPDVKVEALAPA